MMIARTGVIYRSVFNQNAISLWHPSEISKLHYYLRFQSTIRFATSLPDSAAGGPPLDMEDERARNLLNASVRPFGSFSPTDFEEAKFLLIRFRENRRPRTERVKLSLDLLFRAVEEAGSQQMGNNCNDAAAEYVSNPRFYNAFINQWKEAAKRGEDVITPRDLGAKLIDMARKYRIFRYDIVSVGSIMHVTIKQQHRTRAPYVAWEILKLMQDETWQTNGAKLTPNLFIYNQILHAFARSELDDAPDRMDALVRSMKNDGIDGDEVTFNVILRYWANKGAAGNQKMKEVLRQMENDGVQPSIANLAQVVFGFSREGQVKRAEIYFRQMINQHNACNHQHKSLIAESALNLMTAYRQLIQSTNVEDQKERFMQSAEAVFGLVGESKLVASQDIDKLVGMLMDIYACQGDVDKAETLMRRFRSNVVQLTILVKLLGKRDMAARANTLVKRLLVEHTSEVNIRLINTLMNAWAESSRSDAVNQAFDVLRFLNDIPECKIRPDRYTYGTLLKCLAKVQGVTRKDCGKHAINILDEMQSLHNAGQENIFPDVVSYTLALRACLHANDTNRVNELMERMKSSRSTLPNRRSYSELLLYYSKLRSPEAAARCETILAQMKQLAVSNPDLKPDVYSYTIVISAWLRSGFEAASSRAWSLLERMKREKIEPSMITNTVLVKHFCKSGVLEDLQKADFLICCMESRSDSDLPDRQLYFEVINGWLNLGDFERANDVLMRGVKTYSRSQKQECAPSMMMIDMVMQGWIRHGDLERAWTVICTFQELKDRGLVPAGPNLHSYSILREAWKTSTHPRRDVTIRSIEQKLDTIKQIDRKCLFGPLVS